MPIPRCDLRNQPAVQSCRSTTKTSEAIHQPCSEESTQQMHPSTVESPKSRETRHRWQGRRHGRTVRKRLKAGGARAFGTPALHAQRAQRSLRLLYTGRTMNSPNRDWLLSTLPNVNRWELGITFIDKHAYFHTLCFLDRSVIVHIYVYMLNNLSMYHSWHKLPPFRARMASIHSGLQLTNKRQTTSKQGASTV